LNNDEEILLGQIFRKNKVFYNTDLKVDEFQDPNCRIVFKAMHRLVEKGLEIDEVKVFKENPELDSHWLGTLRNHVPSAANHKYYEKRIKKESNKRKVNSWQFIIQDGISQGLDPDAIKEQIEEAITDYSLTTAGWKIKKITEVMLRTIETIEERFKAKGKLPGITSGLESLDNIILGFQKRKLYIFGARPSRGKTALMLNMARSAANEASAGIISTESANEELGIRIVSSETGINTQRLSSGYIKASDFSRLTVAAGTLSNKEISFYDEPNADLATVISKCQEMVRLEKVEIIFIDYLQNIEYNGKNSERENIAHISSKLKSLARTLNIPIVVLAQLQREETPFCRPYMSNLLGSGKMEQDADVIVLIWWQLSKEEKARYLAGAAITDLEFSEWLLIEKARDATVGQCRVNFNKEIVKFTEVAKDFNNEHAVDRSDPYKE